MQHLKQIKVAFRQPLFVYFYQSLKRKPDALAKIDASVRRIDIKLNTLSTRAINGRSIAICTTTLTPSMSSNDAIRSKI